MIIVYYLRLFIFQVDECHAYQNLTDAVRRYDYDQVDTGCDNDLNGWYRFQGAAGTKMVTTSPGRDKCGATFPAWLHGDHPTVADGTVDIEVCINKFEECDVSGNFIKVKNCGSYYIYKFKTINECFRYCVTG